MKITLVWVKDIGSVPAPPTIEIVAHDTKSAFSDETLRERGLNFPVCEDLALLAEPTLRERFC